MFLNMFFGYKLSDFRNPKLYILYTTKPLPQFNHRCSGYGSILIF